MKKVLLPKIRNLYPDILAKDILSVQPMTGPTGQIFSMRSTYSDMRFDGFKWEYGMDIIWKNFVYNRHVNMPDELTLEEHFMILEKMKAKYPGDYILEVSGKGYEMTYKLVFSSPEEESIFLLRHSNE